MFQATSADRSKRPSRAGALYLGLQGIAGVVWWGGLILFPASRDYFKPQGAPDATIMSFWLADLAFFAAGSLLAGTLVYRNSRFSGAVLWFTAGAVSYAALYCVGQSILTNSAWMATAAMLPAMGATLWISFWYQRSSPRS